MNFSMTFRKKSGERLKSGSSYWRKKAPISRGPMPMFFEARYASFEFHSAIMNAGCCTLFMAK